MLDLDQLLEPNAPVPSPATCVFLCHQLIELLVKESNVINVQSPVTVVGDVHGQYYDVLEMLKVGGMPPDTQYLFMGDFVDRGYFSVQTMVMLACFKIKYPHRVWMIRGNHESRNCSKVYGFYDECRSRYGEQAGNQVWNAFTEMFDYIPVAALIDQRIFCTHGGLSPSMQTIDQIRVLPRFQEIPFEGLLTDLMWSDPETDISGFLLSKRGVGYVFGEDVVEQFSKVNDVDYILRAHQLCTDGYQELFKDRLATIWSAPNYCYRSQNKASILEIGADHSKTFKLFESSPDNSKYISEYIPSGKLLDYFY